MGYLQSKLPFLVWISILLFACTTTTSVVKGALKIPFLRRKKYTPLLFFKTPPGILPESDQVENVICQVEKELGVRVERMDILRDPPSQALMALLTSQDPPFLYNRESCQKISFQAPKSGSDERRKSAPIDKNRIRAWAKGRYVPASRAPPSSASGPPPVIVSQEDPGQVDDEALDEMMLSPLQKKGKEAIRERTKGGSSDTA